MSPSTTRSVLRNDSAHGHSPGMFVGQLLMAEEFDPLAIVAGSSREFGSLANFTAALAALDASTSTSASAVALSFCGRRIDFFPNTAMGQYVLPKVDGATIDIDPEYTYSGPHLKTESKRPTVVSTAFENGDGKLEITYDFEKDEARAAWG